MTEQEKNNIYYVCSLIEYIARKTHNHRKNVIEHFSKEDIQWQLQAADVNHCLPFEQVSDEVIEDYQIKSGTYEPEVLSRYSIPSFMAIGAVYQRLVLSTSADDPAQGIINVFSSFITDEISDYNSSTYYMSPDYLRCSYLAGELLT